MKDHAHPPSVLPRLMLVTDRHVTGGRDLVDIVVDACSGGLRFIQIRERDLPADVIRELALDLSEAVPEGTLIVLNGRPELALEVGCGMHLSSAAPFPPAHERPDFWGRAVHDVDEAARAVAAGANYLTSGTVYPTPAKPGFPGRGLEHLETIVVAAKGVPVFAIGGIDEGRVGAVLRAGAHGVAVRRALLEAKRPGEVARRLLAEMG